MRSYGTNHSFNSDLAGERDFNKWGNRVDLLEQLDLELLEARMHSSDPEPRTVPQLDARSDDDELLDAKGVGIKLGLHTDTVRKRFASGAIPGAFPLFGTGPWRISRGNFRRFLDDSARRRRFNVDEIMKRGDPSCALPPAAPSEDAALSTSPAPIPLFSKGSRATRR